MDFQCIEALLELPEFRATGQIIRPHGLELHLERRNTYLVCPRCQGYCSRIKEGRDRCIRDLPILDRPVHIPSNYVVDRRAFEGESGSHRHFLFR